MNSNDTYPSNLPNPLDYERLKEYGLEYIRSIANKQWTDFNLHDPGVTILEALCFALTDLAFRTRFGMADLLTPKDENHPRLSGTLFPAHEVLAHEPITVDDYRKFILESVPGVRNVWIKASEEKYSTADLVGFTGQSEIQVKGLYNIYLELEDEYSIRNSKRAREVVGRDDEGKYAELFDTDYPTFYEHYVRNFMLKHRNLCEDVFEVKVLKPIPVGLFVEIEAESGVDKKEILTELFRVVNAYISPSLDFHTLPELLKKGKTPEEIYQGLLPRYGFIDLDEMKHFEKKKALHTSDILNMLMKIKGIKSIKQLHFFVEDGYKDKVVVNTHNTTISLKETDNYVFCLAPFRWAEPGDPDDTIHSIYFKCDGYSIRPKLTAASPFADNRYAKYYEIDDHYPLPQGKHRNTETYYSFQHLFPKAYRMGLESIPESASKLRKAERLQLKAYLTFFDQLIADYLSQLSAIERYFSIDGTADSIEPTYFFHELHDSEIVDVEKVLTSQKSQEPNAFDLDLDRRNRIMDHLLARFNDSFAEYAVLAYLSNMGNTNNVTLTKTRNIKYKKHLLGDYARLSGARSQAIDYTENLQLTNIERRVMTRLGITNPHFRLAPTVAYSYPKNNKYKQKVRLYVFNDNRDQPYEETFGIHIIEHLLLFPYNPINPDNFLKMNKDESNSHIVADPYSFHVTVVCPGWLPVCQSMQFRTYAERVIRNELPAHVLAKICWVDPLVMYHLEESYKIFINDNLKKRPFSSLEKNETKWREGIDSMVVVMNQFKNLYSHNIEYKLTTKDGSSQARAYYEGWEKGTQVEELPRIDYINLDPWLSEDSSGFWKFKAKEEQTK